MKAIYYSVYIRRIIPSIAFWSAFMSLAMFFSGAEYPPGTGVRFVYALFMGGSMASLFIWLISSSVQQNSQRDQFLSCLPVSRCQVSISLFLAPTIYYFVITILALSALLVLWLINSISLMEFIERIVAAILYFGFAMLCTFFGIIISDIFLKIVTVCILLGLTIVFIGTAGNIDIEESYLYPILVGIFVTISLTICFFIARYYIKDFIEKDLA